ncbi:hypothetical protein HAX54_019311, partial [Datura stramonium]|nr:hypothetical protein [Datura stramonium]
MKCIGPRSFSRLVINKGLLHSDPLVKHGTLKLVLEDFAPDPQVLFSLLSSLNKFYRGLEQCLKRSADSEIGDNMISRKKLKIDVANEDTDIIVELWSLRSSPLPDSTIEDTEVLFYAKLLNALTIYYKTMPNMLEGLFDFFKFYQTTRWHYQICWQLYYLCSKNIKLSSPVLLFLRDAVIESGHKLFYYSDLLRSSLSSIPGTKDISPEFSLSICILDKCLTLVTAESGAFLLREVDDFIIRVQYFKVSPGVSEYLPTSSCVYDSSFTRTVGEVKNLLKSESDGSLCWNYPSPVNSDFACGTIRDSVASLFKSAKPKICKMDHHVLNLIKATFLCVGLHIAGSAFSHLAAYMWQPHEKMPLYLFWGIQQEQYDVILYEKILCKYSNIATRFELDVADACLLKAVKVVKVHKAVEASHPFLKDTCRAVANTHVNILSHCMLKITKRKAEILFLVADISPLYLSVFVQLFFDLRRFGESKKALGIFNSVCSSDCSDLLEFDLTQDGAYSVEESMNVVNRTVAKSMSVQGTSIPEREEVSVSAEEKCRSDCFRRLLHFRLGKNPFLNLLVQSWQLIVKRCSLLSVVDFRQMEVGSCSIFRYLEVYILRNVMEITREMHDCLMNLDSLPFVEQLVGPAILKEPKKDYPDFRYEIQECLEKCQKRKDVMRASSLMSYLQNDFFWSISTNFITERLWMLRLLYSGLNMDDDAQIYIQMPFGNPLQFYVSPISDHESKELIVQIVKKSVRIPKMARRNSFVELTVILE